MLQSVRLDRRTFLVDLGRVTAAYSVLGLAGCTPSSSARPSTGPSASAGSPPSTGPSNEPSGEPSPAASDPDASDPGEAVTWMRVNLGFVSAYVLVRGGEAAVVDTGVEGSADEIEATLGTIGLAWANVGHVILTHRHGDHAGSAAEVLDLAGEAKGYAGAADIPAITVPRPLTPVADGDDVFGMRIDPTAGILVAGDALNNRTGTLAGSSPQNTDNMAEAEASVRKMAELTFETLLVGHGEPIVSGADARVRELAATL